MGSMLDLDALYTSAPIDADYADPESGSPSQEDVMEAAGVMTLAPESFDAAVLDALIHP